MEANPLQTKTERDEYVMDKARVKIHELAGVPASGPRNREERRRVEKVLRRLAKRGLTIS